MSNDFRNQQHHGNSLSQQNGAVRSGNLLHDYRGQSPLSPLPEVPQQSPTSMLPTSGPPPYSPMPPQQAGQSTPPGWPPSEQQGQGWIANTMQVVRRWSGRMAAVPPVDQNPLVLHRSSTSTLTEPKRKRWKRARTVRIAIQMKHRRIRWKHNRPKIHIIFSGILIALLLLLLISTSSGVAYAFKYYQDQLPRLQDLAQQQISQTTRIYDRHGTLLYEAYDDRHQGGGRRTPVSYDNLPSVLKDAQTSAEDPTFWTNYGIDPVGIARAAFQYAQAGSVQSGGSTITQQLIKNMTNDTAQTLSRKLPEAALAIGLTQQYSKEKILEMYFNVSSYGAQDLGVESAVEDYFQLKPQCSGNFKCVPGVYYLNCDANHISACHPDHCDQSKYCNPLVGLARASLLAGMPQDPPTYDPTQGLVDQASGQKYYLERQRYVLDQMLKLNAYVPGLGTVTQQMVDEATALTAKMKFTPYTHPYYHGSQHFVNWVIQQLEEQLGADTFLNGGFNIYTSLDLNVESYVERAVKRHLTQPELQYFGRGDGPLNQVNNLHNAAVVVMDAKTGEVLAMDGSTDYNDSSPQVAGNINMAVQPRQPGSAMKPIVYTTAFEQGWYPGTVVPDFKTYFPKGGASDISGAYVPNDYGGAYSNSNTTIRIATADSRNVPAIKALLYSGVNNVINMAQRMGITAVNTQNSSNVSLALGTTGIPLIQMVGAYQVFANNGVRIPPRSVLDIWDNYGHHLYHFDPAHPGGTQVISPQIAFLMNSVLSDEYARRTEFWPDHDLSFWTPGAYAQPDPGYPDVAAKTGTTDDFKDNWTIGYTSSAVVGVWAGNANDEPMQNVIGITGAAPIWHSVMTYISGMCSSSYDNVDCGKMDIVLKPQTFTPPSGVVKACVSPVDGLAGGSNCDYMLDGEQPSSSGVSSGTTKPKS